MQIIDEITERLPTMKRINDRIIYLSSIHVTIEKRLKTTKQHRTEIFKDILYESKPGPSNERYFNESLIRLCKLEKRETMKIDKIILKKEIGCSIYKLINNE